MQYLFVLQMCVAQQCYCGEAVDKTLHPVAGISKYCKIITLFLLFFELGVGGIGKTAT